MEENHNPMRVLNYVPGVKGNVVNSTQRWIN
jgi:hypothetical protein